MMLIIFFYSRYSGETVSLGASRNSLANDEDPPPYYDIHDMPPLGTCTALYAFEGDNNNVLLI